MSRLRYKTHWNYLGTVFLIKNIQQNEKSNLLQVFLGKKMTNGTKSSIAKNQLQNQPRKAQKNEFIQSPPTIINC
jgi:hypothetical protein